jgi:hypothetical protein
METEPSEAQIEDPNEDGGDEAPEETEDEGTEELGGDESAGTDEAPTGP